MLIALLVLGQSLPGLAALALAMDRHQDRMARRWRGRLARAVLRGVGTACMASSLACAVAGMGGPDGVLLWLGLLTPSALAIIGFLGFRLGGSREHAGKAGD